MTTINGKEYLSSHFSNGGHQEEVTAGTGETLPRFLACIADMLADASRARQTTSLTSKNAGLTGSQSWVLAEDISFVKGAFVVISRTSDPANVYYFGQVTNYVSGTKTLTVSVILAVGSGSSITDWTVALAGARGETGPVRERNRIINGSFAIAQRLTLGSTDNSYGLDCWRLLLEAANAAVVTQEVSDLPSRAKYGAKLTVGSGEDNKFGLFQPIEGKKMWDLRGQNVSVRVPIKATAGITDVRIGIVQFTGTEDAVSGDPISSWGAAGTNPTLAANWSFANTPANISPTTSWADYLVENIAISASATNLGLLIWCDDETTTQTTDILRIGGYVGLWPGIAVPSIIIEDPADELRACRRYLPAITPASAAAGIAMGQCASSTAFAVCLPLPERPRVAPTGISLSDVSHFQAVKADGTLANLATLTFANATLDVITLNGTVASGLAAGDAMHLWAASTSGQILITGPEL